MAGRKNQTIGIRIMMRDGSGSYFCVVDRSNGSGTIDDPYIDRTACAELSRRVTAKLSRTASELYSQDPGVFPEELLK